MPIHCVAANNCVAANKAPAVFSDLSALSRASAAALGLDLDQALANVPVMQGVLDEVDLPRLLQVVLDRDAPACDPEDALYADFITSGDRRMLDQLRAMDPVNCPR